MTHLLDNIFWHCFVGAHAKYSVGTDEVRRYAAGFSPMVAFADPEHPHLDALTPFCTPGEHLYCAGWTGSAPENWKIEAETTLMRMIWNAPAPATDDAPDAILIGPEHTSQVNELVAITRPGPFGPRTIELGDYFGYFDGERLIAMSGERLHAGNLREISAVCTHPAFQGHGYARRLMNKLIRRQMQRGETPFLHVLRSNEGARRLYKSMGFIGYQETVVRAISR